jgi:hypothetical protein
MMDFTKFDSQLDSAVLDPRARMKRMVRETVEFELAHVPADVAADIVGSRLETLAKALVDILEGRDTQKWFELVLDLRDGLRKAIAYERANGRLKPRTPATEIYERCLGSLELHAYNATELKHLVATLEMGELITAVGFHAITTAKRTISRDYLRSDAFKPAGWSNRTSWDSRFTPLSEIALLEQEVAENTRQAARGPGAADMARNLDYQDPYEQQQ